MNILVTGCSRGVGLAICQVFLENGHNVYGVSRGYTEDFKLLEKHYPGRLFFKSMDLQNTENIKEELFDTFITNSIPLDCFVNNAATAYDDIITNIHSVDLENMFRVNVFSPLIITKYAIRNMIFNRIKGSIIHISSISVHTGYKGLAMYASSKGALEAFSKNTAREWGVKGIRSNVVVPGFMETEMSATLTAEQKTRIYNRTSLKEATKVDSVAATVLFLADKGAHSITGQSIHVDAGTI